MKPSILTQGVETAEPMPFFGTRVLRAKAILNRTEEQVKTLEEKFGVDRLLQLVNSIDSSYCSIHTEYYREVIRRRPWPNVVRGGSIDIFQDEFERSALIYAEIGFRALEYLADPPSSDLRRIYRLVCASEGLRGQYGKSSPDGLDSRLERCVEQLGSSLDEETIATVGTPTGSLRTAEAALIEDFLELRSHYPEPPTIDQLVGRGGKATDMAMNFLRRHARWRLDSVAKLYAISTGWESKAEYSRSRRLTTAREQQLALTDTPEELHELVDAIVALNFLNLALEPSFGFKGCVGFAHGLIFQLAEQQHGLTAPDPTDVSNDKWELFSATSIQDLPWG